MAADWVPAVTAGITAAAALGGQAIAGLFQGRNQEHAEARQRRDRAAEVLAEARAFLTDASPDRLGINASPERSPEALRELGERRDRIRMPLLTLAGSHPSPHIRRLAQQLEVEMANMLHMAGWFVSDLLRGRDSETARNQANEHHTAALGLLDQLLDAIHEPETARPVSGGCSGAGERCRAGRVAGEPGQPGRATREAHRRALNRPDGLLRSGAGRVRLRRNDPTPRNDRLLLHSQQPNSL